MASLKLDTDNSYTMSYKFVFILLNFIALIHPIAISSSHTVIAGEAAKESVFVRSRVAEGLQGAVASDDGRCSDVGLDVMARLGGNAIDASVSVALCLGVVNPMSSGIGGGAFLLLHQADSDSAIAYDLREVAPAAAYEDMYSLDLTLREVGGLAVAVPGEVAGLYMVWQNHGSLPWNVLVEPAIKLAKEGFIVSKYLANGITTSANYILADEGLKEMFAPNGTVLTAGDICTRPVLASTLQAIADTGAEAFYNGSIAENLVNDVQAKGGILTLDDLATYRVRVREPIKHDILGLKVFSMPPPSSGGACMALVLNILAAYPNPYEAVKGLLGRHRIVESLKHAFAVRMNLGDPDFVNVTTVVNDMLNASFAAELQQLISDTQTFPPSYYGGRWGQLEDHGTSHFNIVDRNRTIVSMTSTINYPFGARFASKSTGIVLNNQMWDFSIPTSDPGTSPPAPANFIRPYKRPMSSISPTIVLKDGKFLGALGGSGGTKIITSAIQVFIDKFWKGYSALESINAPRLHHQLMPDEVSYENWTTVEGELVAESEAVVDFLKTRGHNLTASTGAITQLIVQELGIEDDMVIKIHRSFSSRRQLRVRNFQKMHKCPPPLYTLTAVSDLRKDGYPAAF